ncbi:MAG: ABC transporter permease [Puia sp.]|nr:ABC transporter permease [Puia sp.]
MANPLLLKNYFRIAWRNLVKHKFYTSIHILGLALGISACLIIFLVTSFELSYDGFHPDKERIYRMVSEFQRNTGEKTPNASIPLPMTEAIRNGLSGIEKVAAFHNYYCGVTIPDGTPEPRRFEQPKEKEDVSPVILADPTYFEVFKYHWLAGDAATALDGPFKVVLTDEEARRYFGDIPFDKVLGRQIDYEDSLHVVVTGIVKAWHQNTDFGFRDIISSATIKSSFLKGGEDNWQMWQQTNQTFVKLAKGVAPSRIVAQIEPLVKEHLKLGHDAKVSIGLQPFSDIHFNAAYDDTYSRHAHLPTLYGLMGIAVFILLIAAINFVNLSTAQSMQRAKETGIRKVLGSSRGSLVIQFLSETLILTLFAVLLSLLITRPTLGAFHDYIPPGVTLNLSSRGVWIFLAGVTIVTSLLAGFYPARVLSAFSPALSLKGTGTQPLNRKSYLRKSLIVFQFTISLVLIISTLVIGRQIHYMLNKDMGFNYDAILTIRTGWNYGPEKKDLLAEKIRQLPEVSFVSVSMGTPADKDHSRTFLSCPATGSKEIRSQMEIFDENFVSLFDLKLVAGRNLEKSDTIKEFLVNETAAKALGFKKPTDAVGQLLKPAMSDTRFEKSGPIVGVLADFHTQSLHEAITPVFMSASNGNSRVINVKLASSGKGIDHFEAALAAIKNQWKQVYPNEKFEYRFFDETIAKFYDKEQKTAQIMRTAMAIAIFISCMGLFGLAAFTAQQRRKEIAIRKVLGAGIGNIVATLTRDILALVALAILIASPIAWYFMHRWLQDYSYRISFSVWMIILAGIAAIGIALVTVSIQALKAAVANPINALRTE